MLNIDTVITNKPFRQVFVTGMYHSGTCAFINELNKRYTVPIYPRGIKNLAMMNIGNTGTIYLHILMIHQYWL